jgi:hypothetical protein
MAAVEAYLDDPQYPAICTQLLHKLVVDKAAVGHEVDPQRIAASVIRQDGLNEFPEVGAHKRFATAEHDSARCLPAPQCGAELVQNDKQVLQRQITAGCPVDVTMLAAKVTPIRDVPLQPENESQLSCTLKRPKSRHQPGIESFKELWCCLLLFVSKHRKLVVAPGRGFGRIRQYG